MSRDKLEKKVHDEELKKRKEQYYKDHEKTKSYKREYYHKKMKLSKTNFKKVPEKC